MSSGHMSSLVQKVTYDSCNLLVNMKVSPLGLDFHDNTNKEGYRPWPSNAAIKSKCRVEFVG